MVHALGWAGTAGGIARWTLPLLAATAAAGFLVTASWLTPAVAHIVLHVTLIIHGSEMPPCDRSVDVVSIGSSQLSSAA